LPGPERENEIERQASGTPNAIQSLDVDAWLEGVGLGQYRALFSEQAIDRDVLPDLTDDDLSRLGVPLGAPTDEAALSSTSALDNGGLLAGLEPWTPSW